MPNCVERGPVSNWCELLIIACRH